MAGCGIGLKKMLVNADCPGTMSLIRNDEFLRRFGQLLAENLHIAFHTVRIIAGIGGAVKRSILTLTYSSVTGSAESKNVGAGIEQAVLQQGVRKRGSGIIFHLPSLLLRIQNLRVLRCRLHRHQCIRSSSLRLHLHLSILPGDGSGLWRGG